MHRSPSMAVLALSSVARAGLSTCCTGPGPGCDDAACEATVCAIDPFCCRSAWDEICVDEAGSLCAIECAAGCGGAEHDCLTTGVPGCSDGACCALVCAADPACCETAWDASCVELAVILCSPSSCNQCCHGDLNNDDVVDGADLGILLACFGEGVRGCQCAQLDGGTAVDGADIGLLLANWGPCQVMVQCVCATADHDCCTTGGPGCTDVWCCEIVCAVDPCCCEQEWDPICVAETHSLCGLRCPELPLVAPEDRDCFGIEPTGPDGR